MNHSFGFKKVLQAFAEHYGVDDSNNTGYIEDNLFFFDKFAVTQNPISGDMLDFWPFNKKTCAFEPPVTVQLDVGELFPDNILNPTIFSMSPNLSAIQVENYFIFSNLPLQFIKYSEDRDGVVKLDVIKHPAHKDPVVINEAGENIVSLNDVVWELTQYGWEVSEVQTQLRNERIAHYKKSWFVRMFGIIKHRLFGPRSVKRASYS